MRRGGLSIVLAAVALCACEAPRPVAPPRQAEPGPAEDFRPPPGFTRLTISTTPYLDPDRLHDSFEPLAAYLKAKLQIDEVEIVTAKSYAHLGELMREGRVDIGSFSPLSFVRARREDRSMQPLVSFISDGSATSAGYVVVKTDGPLRTLEDLQKRSFAYVDPSSTTGFLYPQVLMRSKGINPDSYFSRTEFTGNHEASLLAVFEGKVDGAAIYQGALRALQRNRGIDPLNFRIVAKTMRTPKDIFCARAGLPPEVVTQIRRALLALSVRTGEGRRILTPMDVNGFIPADPSLYDAVGEVDAQFTARGP